MDVVVTTQAGLPDEELLTRMQDYFQQRREIAVDVQVRAPEMVRVNVSIRVSAQDGADAAAVREKVVHTIQTWFNGQRLGEDVLRVKLGALIYGCEGVKNYVITTPTADVLCESGVLPVLGSLSVEELA